MGHNLEVEWQEKLEELKQKYRVEKHPQRREHLFTLWHLRLGKQIREMSEIIVGIDEWLIQRWIALYRVGGLEEVVRQVIGHGTVGAPAYLSRIQQKVLAIRVKLGDFKTVWDVMAWVEVRWGIHYSSEGIRSVMKRNQCVLKVPRSNRRKPMLNSKSSGKKGLKEVVVEQETTQADRWYFSDEIRFGLWGQGRRR